MKKFTSSMTCCGPLSTGPGPAVRLLLLGLDNAGKTCTAKQLVGDDLDRVAPTVGFSNVETKYKGFRVTIFDLGGSKSFRGIWHKYYHEVHGFIFVVDSADAMRLKESAETFADVLQHDKVKGKPMLLLCNKSDVDDAKDEMHIVEVMDVERLVNVAKCPTRVEPCTAIKDQGLREGYKWLVKSVIANLSELGPRVDADVLEEKAKEDERRAEIKRKIEERRKAEEEEEDGADRNASVDEGRPTGFVPLTELKKGWMSNSNGNGIVSRGTNPAGLVPIVHTNGRAEEVKMELEPIKRKKKKSLLQKFNKTAPSEGSSGEASPMPNGEVEKAEEKEDEVEAVAPAAS